MTMVLRNLALVTVGIALAALGVVGLVLPVLPGLVLLLGAAGCFSLASPRFRTAFEQRVSRHPRYRRALRSWQSGVGLPIRQRARLAFWIALASVAPNRRR